MLANTPPTVLLFLAWALLACEAPLLAITGIVLIALSRTRRLGTVALAGGIAGALCSAVGDLLLGLMVGERVSDTTATELIFAALGGFSLFFVTTGVIAHARTHTLR